MTPTVDDVLGRTVVGCGWHDFPTEGGPIRIRTADLRATLEEAYDPAMPDWLAMVWLDEDSMDDSEDHYLPPKEAYLDDCFNDGPESDLWDCFQD